MIELLRKISQEKVIIDKQLEERDERLEFYESFFHKNNCTSLTDAINTNHSDLAIAIIINKAPYLSVEEVKKVVYGNKDIFEELNYDAIGDILKLIEHFANDLDLYKRAKKILLDNTDQKILNKLKEEGKVAVMLRELTDVMKTSPEDFFAFTETFMDESEAYGLALATVSTLREIKDERDFHYHMITEISEEEGKKVKNKVKDKWVSEMIRDDYNIVNLLEPIVAAREEYHQLDHATKLKKRSLSKAKAAYESLEKELYKAVQAGEVRNVHTLISKIPSEQIRIHTLKFIYIHNKELYDAMTKEYQQLAANDASHYQVLLAKYGVSPETYEVGTVMINTIEDLTKMLSLAAKLTFVSPEAILRIAQTSNIETLESIQSLAERGIITAQLLKNNQQVLNPESTEYEDFMHNLALIQQKKLNPHSFTATEEVFLTEHNMFEENIKVLDDYELLQNIKTGNNLSFMQTTTLQEAIDTLLELGYEKNLEECIELLNYRERFDRLKILKSLNIPVTDTDSLIDVLSTDKFYVSDEEISKYIYNASPYKLPRTVVCEQTPKKRVNDITKLSQYSNTLRTYSFDGVLISKNKVHRNLSYISSTKTQDRLIYGVLKDSTLTDEEVQKVVSCLTPQKTTKVVKEKK